MNKRILLLCAILITGLSSCRKDRKCVCSEGDTEIYTANYTHVKKSEAKTYCQALQSTYSTGSNINCKVK